MSSNKLSGQYFTGGYPDDMRGFSLKVKNDGGNLFDADMVDMGIPAAQASMSLMDDAEHGKVLKLADGSLFVPKAGELAAAGIA